MKETTIARKMTLRRSQTWWFRRWRWPNGGDSPGSGQTGKIYSGWPKCWLTYFWLTVAFFLTDTCKAWHHWIPTLVDWKHCRLNGKYFCPHRWMYINFIGLTLILFSSFFGSNELILYISFSATLWRNHISKQMWEIIPWPFGWRQTTFFF